MPVFGRLTLCNINNRMINYFYHSLVNTKPVIAPSTLSIVHKILQTMFRKALEWNIINQNPMIGVMKPKIHHVDRVFWTPEQMALALEHCADTTLSIAIQLAFACTLRKGEILSLTWEDINFDKQVLSVDKELIRVTKESVAKVTNENIIFQFPQQITAKKTHLIIKRPKTKSSIRKVFLPLKLLEQLKDYKEQQYIARDDDYYDYNLIICNPNGTPYNDKNLTYGLRKIAEQTELPRVCFHSIRHSSITYKLMLSNGDIKSVQGDSGHSQSKMVTDLYAHILDDSRRELSQKLNKQFYKGEVYDTDLKDILEMLEQQPNLKQKLKEILHNK